MKFLTVSIDRILPPVVPMRDANDERELDELAADIKVHGIDQPLIVVREGGHWRLVAGQRRLEAAKRAGLLEVPVIERELGEVDQVSVMVRENLLRVQPNPLEEARVFAILREGTGQTLEQLAKVVGRSASYVGTRLSLMEAPADVIEALRQDLINLSVALELAKCEHDGDRSFLLSHAVSGGHNARTVALWVRDAATVRARTPDAAPAEVATLTLEKRPVITYRCEWCHKEVPLESTIAFRVCGEDHYFLQDLRERVTAEETAAATAPTKEG